MPGEPTDGNRRTAALLGSVIAFVVFAGLLIGDRDPRYSLDADGARRAALADERVRSHLRLNPYTSVEVSPLDDELQRVSFFDGSRLLLHAAIDEQGRVRAVSRRRPGVAPTGSKIAYQPLVWLLLVTVTVAVLAGWPRATQRTLDACVLAGFIAAVWAYNEGFVSATVWIGTALLAYLGIRCFQTAFARSAPAQPRRSASGDELRLLRAVAVTMALLVVIVGLTSPGESDVAFASMAGATLLADGISPYGNMPSELIHGDTYPILNYVLHVPAALVLPVYDSFSDWTGALVISCLAGLATAAGIYVASTREWGNAVAWRHVIAWFSFPAVWITASSGTNDLLAAAAIAWGLALLPHAGRAACVLAAGAWIKISPLLVLILWVARARGGDLRRALSGVAAVSAACVAVLVALGGVGEIRVMLDALAFQSERGSLYSVWTQLGARWAQELAVAVVAGALAASAALVAGSSALRGDPVRLAALGGLLLIGMQISANYWTFAYLPWLMPLLLVALFGRQRAIV